MTIKTDTTNRLSDRPTISFAVSTTWFLSSALAFILTACGNKSSEVTPPQVGTFATPSERVGTVPSSTTMTVLSAVPATSVQKMKYTEKFDDKKMDWQYVASLDEMRGDIKLAAGVPSLPNSGRTASLAIIKTDKDPSVAIQGLDDIYCQQKSCKASVRIDDDPVESIDFLPVGRSAFVAQIDFIPRLTTAKSIYIELPIKDSDMVQFHFTPAHPLIWPLPAAG